MAADPRPTRRAKVPSISTDTDPELRHLLAHDPDGFFTVYEGEETSGLRPPTSAPASASCRSCGCCPSTNGRGAGKALLSRILSYGDRSGARDFLAVVPAEPAIQALLLGQGFKPMTTVYQFSLPVSSAARIASRLTGLLPGKDYERPAQPTRAGRYRPHRPRDPQYHPGGRPRLLAQGTSASSGARATGSSNRSVRLRRCGAGRPDRRQHPGLGPRGPRLGPRPRRRRRCRRHHRAAGPFTIRARRRGPSRHRRTPARHGPCLRQRSVPLLRSISFWDTLSPMSEGLRKADDGGRRRVRYEEELNQQQLEVVMHPGGPMLALAVAGTGKTRTLVYRTSRLIEDGVPPGKILLLTFTNKAAREMMGRVEQLVERASTRITGGTFRPRRPSHPQTIRRAARLHTEVFDPRPRGLHGPHGSGTRGYQPRCAGPAITEAPSPGRSL